MSIVTPAKVTTENGAICEETTSDTSCHEGALIFFGAMETINKTMEN